MRFCLTGLLFGFLVITFHAQFLQAQSLPREISVPEAPGVRVTVENEGGPGDDPSGRLLQIVSLYETKLGPATGQSADPAVRSGPGGTFAFCTRLFARDRAHLHAFVTSAQSSAICHVEAPASKNSRQSLVTAVKACSEEFKRAPAAKETPHRGFTKAAPVPPSPVAGAEPPKHPGNWAAVEGVDFRITYISGVGGMPLPDYEPLVFFKDGSYYEIDKTALEDVDLASQKQSHPKRWGRWRQAGSTYSLSASNGHTEDYKLEDGGLFKAFKADAAGNKLASRYKRISGGGNSALGGDVMVAVSSSMQFTPDGQFSGGTNVGALNSGGQTGVSSATGSDRRMPAPGAYQLDNFTLTLRYPDGRIERNFFAFGSQGKPPRVDTDMIFIGSRTFVTD